jgi:hypothetical protein
MRTSLRRVRRVFTMLWPLGLMAGLGALVPLGQASLMRVLYLVLAIGLGRYLQRRDTGRYVAFVIWLWFLSPLVRRVADLFGGWQDPSLVLLTPYLVTALSVPALVAGLLRPSRPALAVAGISVFVVGLLGVAIGIPVGLLIGPSTAALETLNWFLPLCFGWYVATRADEVHRIEASVASTFVLASLVAGLYGIYQFVRPPLWDINWMQRSGMTTIGFPEPFAVRVFGPMHSPGILSAFLVIALVLWMARPRPSGILSAGAAGVALLLSQVRSAWLAFAVGSLFVFGSLNAVQRTRMAVLALVAVAASSVALFTPEMRELVNSRVATMERLEDDESAVARVIGHGLALEFVAEHPLGAGIGQTDPKMEQYISMRDSVLAASLVQFGLPGTLLYLASTAGLLVLLVSYYWSAASIQGAALASAGLGLLASAPFSVVTAGPIGVCLWMIGGLALADRAMRQRHLAAAARRPWPPYHPPGFAAPSPASI